MDFLIYTIVIILFTTVIFLFLRKKKSDEPEISESQPTQAKNQPEIPATKTEESKLSIKELKKLNAQNEKQSKTKRKVTNPDHPFFKSSLKGFGNDITDFCFSNNYIAVACKDKSFKLYKSKQINQENPFFYYHNLGVNYPTCISINGSSENYLACGLSCDKTIEIFEFKESDPNSKYFHSVKKFPSNIHNVEVQNVYYINNSCIITFGGGNDTTIKLWNSNCELILSLNTKQVKHHFSTLSFSSRFLFVGSWCPDVKVFELKLEKNDKSYKSFTKIMDLGLHKSGIDYISCSQNEDKVMTISQDKTVRIWNINVEYEKQGDPKCIAMIDMKKNEYFGENCSITAGDIYSTKDNQGIIAVAERNSIALINLSDMKIFDKIERAHSEESVIKNMKFIVLDGQVYLLSYGTLDYRINIFKIK